MDREGELAHPDRIGGETDERRGFMIDAFGRKLIGILVIDQNAGGISFGADDHGMRFIVGQLDRFSPRASP